MIRWQSNRQHNRYITHVRANMKRREDGAVREVMKELLRSDLRFHKTDCGRFGAMTAWGLKDTSSRPAKDLGGTLRHTYITNLLYAGVDPKTVQYVTVNEVNSNQKFWLDSKKYIEYIANKKCIWYNASRQNDKVKFIYNTAKAPELRPLRLFYSVWAGWLIPPGWLPAAIFYPTICKCSRRLHLPR